MSLEEFNKQDLQTTKEILFSCCGSQKWVDELIKLFPFATEEELINNATRVWYNECSEADWMESYSHHPKIGDVKSLEEKFAPTKHLAGKEQAGVAAASQNLIQEFAKANQDYEPKFGFIFIVCATGKSAEEMLQLINDRLKNSKEEELNIAMGEQHKITILRLKKILIDANWLWLQPSQLTTHVLDTSVGRPAQNVTIKLQQQKNNTWQTIAQGITNADGRIADLLPPEKNLSPSNYKLVFATGIYFSVDNIKTFYPEVEIQFSIVDEQHYHVPLLINPFGFSTYKGT